MRSTLCAVGAFLFMAYPLVMLFTVVRNMDQPGNRPNTAAISHTPRAVNQWTEPEAAPSTYGKLRNTTLRRSGP